MLRLKVSMSPVFCFHSLCPFNILNLCMHGIASLFFMYRCRFSNSSFIAAICIRRSNLNVTVDIIFKYIFIFHFYLGEANIPTLTPLLLSTRNLNVLSGSCRPLLLTSSTSSLRTTFLQLQSSSLNQLIVLIVKFCTSPVPSFHGQLIIHFTIVTHCISGTSLEAQFPSFAFSIFSYPAILRC